MFVLANLYKPLGHWSCAEASSLGWLG